MQLLGSIASPYVRRVRLQLAARDYEFVTINVFTEEGQTLLKKYTPTQRVPVLVDGDNIIWDSLLITEYLNDEPLSIQAKKDLTLINELSDAGIQLFQLRKFGTDEKDQGPFSKNNIKRIENILNFFEEQNLDSWGVREQWLFCTLEWFSYRDVYDWRKGHQNLVTFVNGNKDQPFVKETAPE